MALVFISYRMADAGDPAANLRLHLARCFGAEQVFLDHHELRAGDHYPAALRRQLDRADALVVLIGPKWLRHDGSGHPPPGNWVRREITRSLERDIPVIPVLLDGGELPRSWAEGDPIAAISLRQGRPLRRRDLDQDLRALTRELAAKIPGLLVGRLLEPAPRPAPPTLPSALLRAEREIVPFVGRDEQLTELIDWAIGGPDPVRLLTGPGGQGKTRLAVELCRRLAATGTVAGPVRETLTGAELATVAELDRPVLLVVDRAESRSTQILDLVAAVAGRAPNRPPVRILLVARSGGDWSAGLRRAADDEVAAAFADLRDCVLPPLVPEGGDPAAEFGRAAAAFADRLGRELPMPPVPPGLDLTPVDAGCHQALDLHGAALAAVLGTSGPDPLSRVLDQEERYWAATAPPAERCAQVVTAATVFGAPDDRTARELLAAVPAMTPDLVDRYLGWLRELYPVRSGLGGLGPDRLGEDLAATVHRRWPELLRRCAAVAGPAQVTQALEFLGRAVAHHPELSSAIDEILAVDPRTNVPLVPAAAAALPDPTTLLTPAGTALARADESDLDAAFVDGFPGDSIRLELGTVAAVRAALDRARSRPGTDPARVANLLAILAARLLAAGQPGDGLAAADEAVAGYRTLPDRTAGLVTALANRALARLRLGSPEAARSDADEALDLMGRLSGTGSIGSTAKVKIDLLLASALGDDERRVNLLRRAVEEAGAAAGGADPRASGSDRERLALLGAAQENLGLALPAAEPDAAIAALVAAVSVYRSLAGSAPDPYLRGLTRALINLSAVRVRQADRAGARPDAEEAVGCARELIRRYGPGEARWLDAALTNLRAAQDTD